MHAVMLQRCILFFSCAVLLPGAARAYDAEAMVAASRGTLPLILTVPHDGGEYLGQMPARTGGVLVRDSGTATLAEHVAAALETRLGQRPYLVLARFSRKYLDANRIEAEALETPAALPAYQAYHGRIASYLGELRTRFPGGALLLDVHGQGREPDTAFRGTRAGLTAAQLLARAGADALQGQYSITGLLAAKGYQVYPAPGAKTLRENPHFDGGYTVFTYGSHRASGIDAIQLEFGKQQRANPRLAEDLADALIVFMRRYGYLPR